MTDENKGNLDTLVQEKLEADVDFNETLVDMSDEDKETAISERKSELMPEVAQELFDKNNKNEELAGNYKIRAEKAEGGKKPKAGDKTPKTEEGQLSQKDLLAVMKADVNSEDLDEVVDYAKLKGISVTEALKTPMIKSILDTKAEERQTADATNVNGSKRKTAQVSTDTLLENARKGEFPENDKDIERLIKAEKGL